MKTCGRCNTEKELSEFNREKKSPDGHQSRCRACCKEHMEEYKLPYQFGITREDYNKMLEEQGGTCYICGTEPGKRRLAVDHCHSTGDVRGLLCAPCNTGLGFFQDNPDLLLNAIQYLNR